MKKLFLIILFLLSITSCTISQVRHVPLYSVPHSDSTYNRNIPAGSEIIDLNTHRVYLLTAPVMASSTLLATSSKIEISNNGLIPISENGNTGYILSSEINSSRDSIGNGAVDISRHINSYSGATGDYSFSTNIAGVASGNYSFAANYGTVAAGETSSAFGSFTNASGRSSFAINNSTVASGVASSSFGNYTIASGNNSVSFGHYTNATGENSFCGGDGYSPGSSVMKNKSSGRGSFNFSHGWGMNDYDAAADYSAILAGTNNTIQSTAVNSAIIAGENIVATLPNTVYTPNLRATKNVYVDSVFSRTGDTVWVQGSKSGWDGKSDLTVDGYTTNGGSTFVGYGLNSIYGGSILKHGITSALDGATGNMTYTAVGDDNNILKLKGLNTSTIRLSSNTLITGTNANNTVTSLLIGGNYTNEVIFGDQNLQTVLQSTGGITNPVVRKNSGDYAVLTDETGGFYSDDDHGNKYWQLYNETLPLLTIEDKTVYAPNLTVYDQKLTVDSIYSLNNSSVWIEGLQQGSSLWKKSGDFLFPLGNSDIITTNNGLVLGDAITTTTGMVKYDGTNFKGYNGTSWVNFDEPGGTPQTLTLNADTLTISDGNSVVLSPSPKIGYLTLSTRQSLSLSAISQTITGYTSKTEKGITADITNGTLTLPKITGAIYEVVATGSVELTGDASTRYITFDLYNQTTSTVVGTFVWDVGSQIERISRSFTIPIENSNPDTYIIRIKADASTSVDLIGLIFMFKRIF